MEINARVLEEIRKRIDVQGSIPGPWSLALAQRIEELEQSSGCLHLIVRNLERDRDYWMERALSEEVG